MELKFNGVYYIGHLNNIDLEIKSGSIIGMYNAKDLLDVIVNKHLIDKGTITLDNMVLNSRIEPKSIAFISRYNLDFYTARVIDEIFFNAKIRGYKNKRIKSRISELLEKLSLTEDILYRIMHSLSRSERFFVNILINLVYNPKVIIFDNILEEFDGKNRKVIKQLIAELKEQGKIVILNSSNSNNLYDYSEEVIIMNKGKIITFGKTDDVYSNVEILVKNNIEIPDLSELTYKAKVKKDINMFYRKDVRDTIKDIYRNVEQN